MSFLDVKLSADDTWINRYTDVRFLHDLDVKNPDKLATLSGEVKYTCLNCGRELLPITVKNNVGEWRTDHICPECNGGVCG